MKITADLLKNLDSTVLSQSERFFCGGSAHRAARVKNIKFKAFRGHAPRKAYSARTAVREPSLLKNIVFQ